MADSSIDKLLQKALQDNNNDLDLKVLLEAKMQEYDLTKTKVRTLLNIEFDTFEDMINGTAKQPSLINVIKLAEFLEISESDAIAAVLKNLDANHIASIEKAKAASFIAKNFDIKKLSKIGFFNSTDDAEIMLDRILAFFGYKSIYEFKNELDLPLYHKTKRTYSDKMKDFWIKSAYQCFIDISNPNEYNREALKELIVNIKPYSQDVENGLYTVCRALYNVGVTVIVQNHLTTTQIFGATLIVKGKPCIVLTDLNKKYPNLWITLLHELEHVLYDQEIIANTVFHITGDPDLFLIEEKAIEFSWDYFCDIAKYNFIKIHINNPYVIEKFAQENEVHKSILYWSFMHYQMKLHNKNAYAYFGEHFPDYNKAIKNLKPITWKEGSLTEVAKELKQIFELQTI